MGRKKKRLRLRKRIEKNRANKNFQIPKLVLEEKPEVPKAPVQKVKRSSAPTPRKATTRKKRTSKTKK